MNREVQLNLPITHSSVGRKDAKLMIRVRTESWIPEILFFKATSALVISEILFVFVKSYPISRVRLQRIMKALFRAIFRKTQECVDH